MLLLNFNVRKAVSQMFQNALNLKSLFSSQ